MLSPLVGLAKGLEGRSVPLWLICEGRRTKGLLFTGERESGLVGEKLCDVFVGDVVGVVARVFVAGDWLFCRLKGDWRPESKLRGVGRSWLAWQNLACNGVLHLRAGRTIAIYVDVSILQ